MPTRLASPILDYLKRLHADLAGLSDGQVATYIPELAKAAPESFAISFATIDGEVYSVGDSDRTFSIQSVSKPFAYGAALGRLGQQAILRRVGVEPTGEAFNSILLDDRNNRPFNPMVNAGAIAISALAEGATPDERVANMRALFSEFAGRPLDLDEAVYRSEAETGHRNRAIAYLMLNSGMIDRDPESVLDLYFRQCALLVTTEDLALMGATLANNGVQPRTGRRLLGPGEVRDVLTLMMSCGMYDYAGEWSYEVGLPAKSGVSGAVLAVLPGQVSIAIWSPPLDPIGNSVRGVAACRRISQDLGLHLFLNAATVEDVLRRHTTASRQPSMRIRTPRDRDILQQEGGKIALVELQGALYLASAERLIRRLQEIVEGARYLIFDFRRLNSIDAAALRFFNEFLAATRGAGLEIAFADIGGGAAGTAEMLATLARDNAVQVFGPVDEALARCEDKVLAATRQPHDYSRFALDTIDLFKGLGPAQIATLQSLIQPMQFDAGDRVLRSGEEGRMFFVLARGTVSVMVRGESAEQVRVSCIGPGQFFGEMAVLGGGIRSADVIADERIICYGLTVDQLDHLTATEPLIVTVILANMAREFAARIRRGNAIISSLQ